jgi:hypothetical protein
MKRLWPVVFPLVRPAVLVLASVLAAQLVAVLALWGVRHFLYPGWQQAEATQQAAQGQLEEARAEQADVHNHLRQYQRMVAAGLVGGEPRAVWVEDLLRILQQQDLQSQASFTLAAPEAVELPQAAAAQTRVQRHVLELQFARVHEIEVLRALEQLHQRHALVSRMAGCVFEQATPEGLSARCRVNFLHIDLIPGADQNAPQ